jgi:hypothetical protein
MEKKNEQHFNYDDTKWSKHFNKNKKKLIYYKKISRRSYLHAVEMTSRIFNVLACHSEISLLAIEESSLLAIRIHEISRHSYLRSVEMTSRLDKVLACHSEMSLFSD